MWKVNDDRRHTTDAKWWKKLTLPLARWSKKKEKVYHPSFQKLELSNHLDSFLFHTSICDILTWNSINWTVINDTKSTVHG
jgi:hypothetical protein